jgi:hypothetical protein
MDLAITRIEGSIRVPRVLFGVPPNIAFRRDAGKLHAGPRALPTQ